MAYSVKYLETFEFGLTWLQEYYFENPQLNRRTVLSSLSKAESMLAEFPKIGKMYENSTRIRELKLKGTAFSLLYVFERDTVWILDIRDQRGQRSDRRLSLFLAILDD